MAKVTRSVNYFNEVNVKAFLKLIRYCEHQRREDPGVYYVLYGGGHFTDPSTHPLTEPIYAWGYYSTAAGAYQILHKTWVVMEKRGIAHDFTPNSQDRIALQIIKDFHALEDVRDGNIQKAIHKLCGQWTSFPGASQQQIDMEKAVRVCNRFVKEYSKK